MTSQSKNAFKDDFQSQYVACAICFILNDSTLKALTLQHLRLLILTSRVFTSLHGLTNCFPLSLGLALSTFITRGGDSRCKFEPKIHSSLFCCRSPIEST